MIRRIAKLKRIITSLLLVATIVPFLQFGMAPIAFAGYSGPPPADKPGQLLANADRKVGNASIIAGTAIEGTMLGQFISWLTKEFSLDTIAWTIMKILIQEISLSIQRWILSGFQGSPAFIQNFEGVLRDAADRAAGEFIASSDFAFVCDPFRLDLQFALLANFRAGRDGNGPRGCTLTGSLENIERFANGAFADAGKWVTFDQALRGENNEMSQLIDGELKIRARIVSAKNSEVTQATYNSGFNSREFCALFSGSGDGPTGGEAGIGAARPGNAGDGLRGGGSDLAPGQAPLPNARPSRLAPPQSPLPTARPGTEETPADVARWRTFTPGANGNCLEELVHTPGKVIFEFFDQSLKMPQLGAVVADEIGEIVSTLLIQVSRMALQGAMGLLGLGDPQYNPSGSGRSYLDDIGRDIDRLRTESVNDGYANNLTGPTEEFIDVYLNINERYQEVLGTRPDSAAQQLFAAYPSCSISNPGRWSTLDNPGTAIQEATAINNARTKAVQTVQSEEFLTLQDTIDRVKEVQGATTGGGNSCGDTIDNRTQNYCYLPPAIDDNNPDTDDTPEYICATPDGADASDPDCLDDNGIYDPDRLEDVLTFSCSDGRDNRVENGPLPYIDPEEGNPTVLSATPDGADIDDPDCHTDGDPKLGQDFSIRSATYNPDLQEDAIPQGAGGLELYATDSRRLESGADLINIIQSGVLKDDGDVAQARYEFADFYTSIDWIESQIEAAYNTCEAELQANLDGGSGSGGSRNDGGGDAGGDGGGRGGNDGGDSGDSGGGEGSGPGGNGAAG